MTTTVEPLIGTTVSQTLAMFGLDAEKLGMLDYCQSLGEVFVGRVDGEFLCCFGLIPPSFLATQAYLWMWAPDPLPHQFIVVRRSQIEIERMLDRYDELVGECLLSARSSRRWLQWLGAEFGQPKDGLIPFTIRKANG